jgi:dienelactone hydrolase
MFRETVHCFGDGNILCGVLTQPVNIAVDDLCVVFLNAGLVHKVGPYRMNVDMARSVAEIGVPAFRFDLSGLGDSLKRDSNQTDEERALLDIREAFDYLEETVGIKRFILFGLCSGADNAHAVALVDPRVVGAVILDGHAYPNLQYQVKRLAPKILRLKSWNTLARSVLSSSDQTVKSQDVYSRTFAPREQVESEINELVSRGVELLYVYSGGYNYFNHVTQFSENFPSVAVNSRTARVQCEYFSHAEHTYTDPRDRRVLVDRVMKWIRGNFL